MPRQEKRTRIKGLPPKLYLQQRDARSGSYPSIVRIASDNRTGKFNVFYDDTKTMVSTTSSNNVSLGAGVETSLLTREEYQEFGVDMSSSFSASGSIRKGVSDVHLAFTPGQPWVPFKEENLFAADVKSNVDDEFFATGSNVSKVGEGFSQPLWAKSKIEIDLTPSSECTLQLAESFVGGPAGWERNCYPMGYWNKVDKIWEGIGDGYSPSYYLSESFDQAAKAGVDALSDAHDAFDNFLKNFALGFANGLKTGRDAATPGSATEEADAPHYYHEIETNFNKMMGEPVSDFQFPFHPKFHATSSNTIQMSDYISEPFILEKAVLVYSGAFALNKYCGPGINDDVSRPYIVYNTAGLIECSASMACVNFFILNQRSVAVENFTYAFNNNVSQKGRLDDFDLDLDSEETTRRLNRWSVPDRYNNSGSYTDYKSIRDLVTWFSHMSYTTSSIYWDHSSRTTAVRQNLDAASKRELNTIGQVEWSGKYVISGVMKSMLFREASNVIRMTGRERDTTANKYDGTITGHGGLGIVQPGRNGLNRLSSKSLRNTFFASQTSSGSLLLSAKGIDGAFGLAYVSTSYDNPYILTPEDNLVFGWQVPLSTEVLSHVTGGTGAGFHGNLWGVNDNGEPPGPSLTFAPAPAKIIFYGSYVRNGKEHHDTLNQLLTSETVHEVIE